MERIVMGYWACPKCGTYGIEGLKDTCPSCGFIKDKTVKYYMDPTQPVYLDNHMNVGPDWYCTQCGRANKANIQSCISCGENKSSKDYFEETGRNKNKVYHSLDEFGDIYEEKMVTDNSLRSHKLTHLKRNPYTSNIVNEEIRVSHSEPETMNDSNGFVLSEHLRLGLLLAGAGILAAVLIYLIISLFQPKKQVLDIAQYSWSREIRVESLQNVMESDWHMPQGGVFEYMQEEIHHWDSVFDHYNTITQTHTETVVVGYNTVVAGYSDNGDGTFTELTSSEPIYDTRVWTETYDEPVYIQVPVYEYKYYYTIDRWLYSHSLTSEGVNSEPFWNEEVLNDLERESNRIDKYTIDTINEKEKEQSFNLDYQKWNNLRLEETTVIEAYVDILGNLSFEE